MKKVVEAKAVWPMFKPVFNISEPGEKGQAKNLKWMERINELRRIPCAPSERAQIQDGFIDLPYTVMHNNGFVKYKAQLFSSLDQARLAKAIVNSSP